MDNLYLDEYYRRPKKVHNSFYEEMPLLPHYVRRMQALASSPGYTYHIDEENGVLVQEKMEADHSHS